MPLPIPANAMAFPGAKPAGDFSHLSRLPSVHFRVALAANAEEGLLVSGVMDNKLIAELNRRLAIDPDYKLPDGY